MENQEPRRATVRRETAETKVSVELCLDGTGKYEIATGNGMLDHLLAQLSRHGMLDLKVEAKGDLSTGWHHLVEDVAIVLGRGLRQALGEGLGIVRMGHAIVPLDEALATVAVDVGGRGYAVVETGLTGERVGDLPTDLVRHFLESFAIEARVTLHTKVERGKNDHHRAEALFKALAKALRQAVERDRRAPGEVPSTKGTISG
ncbi:MAG: imidazoleglycerol-phosphate dehydratase HisB [Chloroflexi bacterium]|nr:imidazoleglycerol-phosphate dehydratase HisB [Chloroflexota bacterium]